MSKANFTPLSLWGTVFVVLGIMLYVIAALLGLVRAILFQSVVSKDFIEVVLWYSPIPIFVGIALFLIGLLKIAETRSTKTLLETDYISSGITVALTAYNDEESIADAVIDFKRHQSVDKVIVISNNSTDNTLEFAQKAGAIAFNESKQGYGACVHRAMTEACAHDESGVVVISEGDMTFRANDLEKMLPYLAHVDVVNGTRIVETLQAPSTQLSMFMHYGNLFVAKLLEVKYFGSVSLTDVGTTYKVAKKTSLEALLPDLDSDVNLAFNPHFLETVVSSGKKLVEVPITFHPRVGESKGGNISNKVALKFGAKMILGILFTWDIAK